MDDSHRCSWRAPGRINLIGEHTDYNEGFVLPIAIAQGCVAGARRDRDSAAITIESAQRHGPVRIEPDELVPGRAWLSGEDGWAGYAAGVAWALARAGLLPEPPTGVRISLDSDVPAGGGLSSSAALGCSVAGALTELLELDVDRRQLAELARVAESEFVGAPTGGMDQLASMLCTPGHALLCDMRSLQTDPVPLDLAAAGLSLLVVDTRAEHRNADGEYQNRRAECEQAARELGVAALRDATEADLDRLGRSDRPDASLLRRRARHVVTENRRVQEAAALLRDGDLVSLGELFTASHTSMRDDFEITVPEVDTAVEALMAAGAVGARMTGGGFGGCVIGLAPGERVGSASERVRAAFDRHGFTEPATFQARPSAGAGPWPPAAP